MEDDDAETSPIDGSRTRDDASNPESERSSEPGEPGVGSAADGVEAADDEPARAGSDDGVDSDGDGDSNGDVGSNDAGRDGVDPDDVAPGNADEREEGADDEAEANADEAPADVRKYARFKKVDGAQYDRVNDFLRDRTYVTAREWAIARLCADFRTETGVEMTKIGENLPELVPFMTDTYTPQAVNQARSSFEGKVRKSGATFLYGAMSGFFTAEELDELMYEVTEIAKFLLEVEGVDLSVEEELEAEERISSVMREVREASADLRAEELSEQGDGDEDGDDSETADGA